MKRQSTKQRVYSSWDKDGLSEIFVGVIFLLAGLFCVLTQLFFSAWSGLAGWLFGIVLLIIIPLTRFALVQTKKRLVYPRTGYIEYREPGRIRLVSAILLSFFVGVVFGLMVIYVRLSPWWENIYVSVVPLLASVIVSVPFIWIWYKAGLARYFIFSICAVLVGCILTFMHYPLTIALAIFFFITGIALLITGIVIFDRYLHKYAVFNEGE